jgi:hypothetical protein
MNDLVSAVSVAVVLGLGCSESSVAAKPKTSQVFPNVKLPTHTDKTYDARSLRGDYVVVPDPGAATMLRQPLPKAVRRR